MTDQKMQDVLTAVTDALLADDGSLEAVLAQYQVSRAQFNGLIDLISRLHITLVGVKPSRRFARQLKADLIGSEQHSIVRRLRYLPARVQIAAAVALVAGFMLIARRRLADDTPKVAPQPTGEIVS